MGNIRLLISRGDGLYDATEAAVKIKWSGRKGTPARKIEASVYCPGSSPADVSSGHGAMLYDGDTELFRGILTGSRRSGGVFSFTAYDNGIYLANNRDSFTYENRTAGYIFRDICRRLDLPVGEIADTRHIVSPIVSSGVTPWDIICNALQQTYTAEGVRYYPVSLGGRMHLKQRVIGPEQWLLDDDGSIGGFEYSDDIGDTRTRVRVLSYAGEICAEAADEALERKIGIFADTVRPGYSMTAGQARTIALAELRKKAKVRKRIEVSSPGQTELISGRAAYIRIKRLGIARAFYIDSDEHVFCKGVHRMKLLLTYDDEYEFA